MGKPETSSGRAAVVLVIGGLLISGCSINQLVVNKVGDALASGGTTFAADDDPELIKAAAPFSLKLMESLLAESPKHRGLLLAASSGFTQYAFAFVQQEADELEATDYAGAQAKRERAKRLYIRARNYGLRGLEARYPGFTAALAADPKSAAARAVKKDDAAQLYWAAASWGAAISLGKDDPALIAEIPQMEALIDRSLALDEAWGDGSIHGFLINYELTRQGLTGDPVERARSHFERARGLAAGKQAAPFVTYAEAVCVEKQDLAQFDALLQQALAIDADAHPEFRIANLAMQRRARWLIAQRENLFLTTGVSNPR